MVCKWSTTVVVEIEVTPSVVVEVMVVVRLVGAFVTFNVVEQASTQRTVFEDTQVWTAQGYFTIVYI